MITFTHATTRYTVTEANAAKVRAQLDSGKPPKFKRSTDAKHDSMRREYPVFTPGMSTADYVSRFASLNNRLYLSAWAHTHADRAAPMLDATQPEVLEEIDPDYVEQAPAPKRKAATAAQLRAAALELIQTLEGMAVHPSHYAKLKGLL